MKSKLKIIILVAAMAAAANAQASERIGYSVRGTPSMGGSGQADDMLSSSDIDSALLDGIRAAGISLDVSKTSGTRVEFEFLTAYVPTGGNLRVISGTVTLREEATVRGNLRSVGICVWIFQEARAGPSVQQHVKDLLESIRGHGTSFANRCLK